MHCSFNPGVYCYIHYPGLSGVTSVTNFYFQNMHQIKESMVILVETMSEPTLVSSHAPSNVRNYFTVVEPGICGNNIGCTQEKPNWLTINWMSTAWSYSKMINSGGRRHIEQKESWGTTLRGCGDFFLSLILVLCDKMFKGLLNNTREQGAVHLIDSDHTVYGERVSWSTDQPGRQQTFCIQGTIEKNIILGVYETIVTTTLTIQSANPRWPFSHE